MPFDAWELFRAFGIGVGLFGLLVVLVAALTDHEGTGGGL